MNKILSLSKHNSSFLRKPLTFKRPSFSSFCLFVLLFFFKSANGFPVSPLPRLADRRLSGTLSVANNLSRYALHNNQDNEYSAEEGRFLNKINHLSYTQLLQLQECVSNNQSLLNLDSKLHPVVLDTIFDSNLKTFVTETLNDYISEFKIMDQRLKMLYEALLIKHQGAYLAILDINEGFLLKKNFKDFLITSFASNQDQIIADVKKLLYSDTHDKSFLGKSYFLFFQSIREFVGKDTDNIKELQSIFKDVRFLFDSSKRICDKVGEDLLNQMFEDVLCKLSEDEDLNSLVFFAFNDINLAKNIAEVLFEDSLAKLELFNELLNNIKYIEFLHLRSSDLKVKNNCSDFLDFFMQNNLDKKDVFLMQKSSAEKKAQRTLNTYFPNLFKSFDFSEQDFTTAYVISIRFNDFLSKRNIAKYQDSGSLQRDFNNLMRDCSNSRELSLFLNTLTQIEIKDINKISVALSLLRENMYFNPYILGGG